MYSYVCTYISIYIYICAGLRLLPPVGRQSYVFFWVSCMLTALPEFRRNFTGISSECHQNFTRIHHNFIRISPESHRKFTGTSSELHRNFARISPEHRIEAPSTRGWPQLALPALPPGPCPARGGYYYYYYYYYCYYCYCCYCCYYCYCYYYYYYCYYYYYYDYYDYDYYYRYRSSCLRC